MTNSTDDPRVLLGQIIAVHGIRGDLIVRSYAADPADVAAYGPLTDKAGGAPLFLRVIRVSDKGVVVRANGISDRNGAEALKGRELYILRSQLPEAAPEEYYHADLVGLEAVTADGQTFGRVIAVQNFGAGDLLEILTPGARDTELIPFTNACVPHVDLAAGRIVVVAPAVTGEPEPVSNEGGEDL